MPSGCHQRVSFVCYGSARLEVKNRVFSVLAKEQWNEVFVSFHFYATDKRELGNNTLGSIFWTIESWICTLYPTIMLTPNVIKFWSMYLRKTFLFLESVFIFSAYLNWCHLWNGNYSSLTIYKDTGANRRITLPW